MWPSVDVLQRPREQSIPRHAPAPRKRGMLAYKISPMHRESQRARVGRVAAQRRGVRFGRPPKLRAAQQALACRLMTEGQSAKDIAQLFGVHVATIYRMAHAHSA